MLKFILSGLLILFLTISCINNTSGVSYYKIFSGELLVQLPEHQRHQQEMERKYPARNKTKTIVKKETKIIYQDSEDTKNQNKILIGVGICLVIIILILVFRKRGN